MQLVFGRVSADSADGYIREKLRSALRAPHGNGDGNGDTLEEQLEELAGTAGGGAPVLSREPEREVAPGSEAEIEARKRCALETLMRESPLLEGEQVEEDFFSFLEEPFEMTPARTVALRRRTNMAELYYIFDEVTVADGGLSFSEPPVRAWAAPAMVGSDPINSLISLAASHLAKGLAGAIPGKVGAYAMEKIFPPGVPSYFDEVYEQIKKIVSKELEEHQIRLLRNTIRGTQDWLENTYLPKKRAGDERVNLTRLLQPYYDKIQQEVIFTLMDEGYARAGFSVFMLAAGIHLSLTQELALVDPAKPPRGSSYAHTISFKAQQYHDHAVKTFGEIVRARREQVKLCSGSSLLTGRSMTNMMEHYWCDELTKEEGQKFTSYLNRATKQTEDQKKEAEADRDRRRDEVEQRLSKDLHNPKETAGNWLKLVENPIPAESA